MGETALKKKTLQHNNTGLTSMKSIVNEQKGGGSMRDKIIADVKKEISNFVTKLEYEDQKVEIQRALGAIGVFKYKMELQEQMAQNRTYDAKVEAIEREVQDSLSGLTVEAYKKMGPAEQLKMLNGI